MNFISLCFLKILRITRRLRRLASASRWHTPPPPSLQWGIMYIRAALDLNVSLEALTSARYARYGQGFKVHNTAKPWFGSNNKDSKKLTQSHNWESLKKAFVIKAMRNQSFCCILWKNNSFTGIKLISLASQISETVKIQQKARGRETCSMVSPIKKAKTTKAALHLRVDFDPKRT